MIVFPGAAGGSCSGVSLCLHLQPGWFESKKSKLKKNGQEEISRVVVECLLLLL